MLKIQVEKKILIYNVFITILSLIAIGLTILDLAEVINIDENVNLLIADRIILILFNIDYWTRFYLAKGKRWYFFKENIFDR